MIRDRELSISWRADDDPLELRTREWLVTNGLGGYASGSLAGVPTRKYHGLFVPNLSAPKGRHIMLSRCDEEVHFQGKRLLLGGGEFADNRLESDTHLYLREFKLDRRIAVWLFDLGGIWLEKSLVMPHNQNIVCVQYRLTHGAGPISIRVRPFVSFRRHDDAPARDVDRPFILSISQGRHEVRLNDNPLVLRMAMRPTPAVFVAEDNHAVDFLYRIERTRGDPDLESAFSPGYFCATVTADQPASFIATTQSWERINFDVAAALDAERRRSDGLLNLAGQDRDEFAQQLTLAADQFIVLPGSRLEETVLAQAEGSDLRTVFAGYHWFGDWGRDTMISLEGLTLCTGRHREASAILRTFSHYVKDGLLPNLFPEGERQALYHTVDATLWYFHAIARYTQYTRDRSLITQLYPVLQSIIEHHLTGTLFGIHADPEDGLITAAAEGYQLTWMDAKVDGWVVTPRRGKPVEIQALWFNALSHMSVWSKELGRSSELFEKQAALVQRTFNNRYWNESVGCLYDVIDGPTGNDAAIRPNQVFSMSLDYPVLDAKHWADVLRVVRERLLTAYGLRTLSADHPDYKTHYRGNLRARDAAYHQGTVWPWLIGHYIDAYLKVHEDRAGARAMLEAFRTHLSDAGIGSISEIFDAEGPYEPAGCIAQAWSVAEVLRAWLKTRPS